MTHARNEYIISRKEPDNGLTRPPNRIKPNCPKTPGSAIRRNRSGFRRSGLESGVCRTQTTCRKSRCARKTMTSSHTSQVAGGSPESCPSEAGANRLHSSQSLLLSVNPLTRQHLSGPFRRRVVRLPSGWPLRRAPRAGSGSGRSTSGRRARRGPRTAWPRPSGRQVRARGTRPRARWPRVP